MIGQKLGAYDVLAKLGAGGMGEVYRARDTKLGREVALKILPEAFASDPDRLMRFEREARTLAALNHPHIAQVYGIEDSGTTRALVMELVEGEDLSARIARGPIPLEEALPIAQQIAEALEAAHDAGIIHRDLKPANVKVRDDGTVKVLDFGLAKALDATPDARGDGAPITSPAMTMRGVIMGTAAYMAPEQAKGKPVDKRADIWAFGVVLYEMLTGERPFKGDDISEIMAAVLRDEPAFVTLPAGTPAHVRTTLARCLQKDVRRRIKDIGDVRLELTEGVDVTPPTLPVTRAAPLARERMAWALAAVFGVAAAILAVPGTRSPGAATDAAPLIRFKIDAPSPYTFMRQRGSLALSPDGRRLAFVGVTGAGAGRLWLRSMDAVDAFEIAQTTPFVGWTAAAPSWSPDGRHLLITAGTSTGGPVRRIDPAGGPSTVLAEWGSYAVWGEGHVLYTGADRRVHRVAESGGPSSPVTTIDVAAGETFHVALQVLPGGRQFLLSAPEFNQSRAGVYIASLEGGERTLLPGVMGAARYEAGHLLFIHDGTLVARRFDPAAALFSGETVPLADSVDDFTVARDTLVARHRDTTGRTMAWSDGRGSAGTPLGSLGTFRDGERPNLSRDGRLLAFTRRDASGRTDLWVLDTERNIPLRLTADDAEEEAPVLSPDGTRVVYSSTKRGTRDLYIRSTAGHGDEELLYASDAPKRPSSFSPDGSLLLFTHVVPETGADIWVLPLAGERKPRPLIVTSSLEGEAMFSSDGRWIVYCAGDPGEGDQVYLAPYPPDGSRTRLSTDFASSPVWGPKDDQVFFGTPDGTIMRVPLSLTGRAVRAGTPTAWLKAPGLFAHLSFVLDPTAQRALVPTADASEHQALTAIVNWSSLLSSR